MLTLLERALGDLEEHHNDPNHIEYFSPNLSVFDGQLYAPKRNVSNPLLVEVLYSPVLARNDIRTNSLAVGVRTSLKLKKSFDFIKI